MESNRSDEEKIPQIHFFNLQNNEIADPRSIDQTTDYQASDHLTQTHVVALCGDRERQEDQFALGQIPEFRGLSPVQQAQVIHNTVADLQSEIEELKLVSGTTLCATLFLGPTILVAHMGDSAAILVTRRKSDGELIYFTPITIPHHIDESLKDILKKAGHRIDEYDPKDYRLISDDGEWNLNMLSSLGDLSFKHSGLMREAIIYHVSYTVSDDQETCIMNMSDGVTDYLTNEDIKKFFETHQSLSMNDLANALALEGQKAAREKHNKSDNVIVCVTELKNIEQYQFHAVMDGHGGPDTSMYVSRYLQQALVLACQNYKLKMSSSALLARQSSQRKCHTSDKPTKNINSNEFLCMPMNLKDCAYTGKADMDKVVEALADCKPDAYTLSLPLMASALQGNYSLYQHLLQSMNLALGSLGEDPFKAWILGRILYAANSIDDTTTIKQILPLLSKLLTDLQSQERGVKDSSHAMMLWSYAYLAALNPEVYLDWREKMKSSIEVFESAVFSQAYTHDEMSNVVWAEVMAIQAAANANDRETYQTFLNGMRTVTVQHSVKDALNFALTRTASSSDYPAWALSIVFLAAVKMGDDELCDELKEPLENAIDESIAWGIAPNQIEANQWKAKAEAVLARLNYEWVQEVMRHRVEVDLESTAHQEKDQESPRAAQS